jgi:predicted nucleic acid-binding protein
MRRVFVDTNVFLHFLTQDDLTKAEEARRLFASAVAVTPLRRHRFVTATTAVAIFKAAPALDAGRFRADLDAWARQDPRPRA